MKYFTSENSPIYGTSSYIAAMQQDLHRINKHISHQKSSAVAVPPVSFETGQYKGVALTGRQHEWKKEVGETEREKRKTLKQRQAEHRKTRKMYTCTITNHHTYNHKSPHVHPCLSPQAINMRVWKHKHQNKCAHESLLQGHGGAPANRHN